jgi:DNA topoisomerase-3
VAPEAPAKAAKTTKTTKTAKTGKGKLEGQPCPVCGQGTIIRGKTAYGCSRWKEGCTFRKPFT